MATAVARKDEDRRPDTYGPAMQALNDRQRVYVMRFVICANGSQAAREAGYGTPDTTVDGWARIAYQIMQSDVVQLAIVEETRRWFRSAAAAAVREIHRILDDPKAKDADKLRAADGILARIDPVISGQVLRVEHEHHHHIDHTAAALESLRWMKSMQVPREKLVEYFGYSGLPRYEKQLADEDMKAGKLIEGRAEAAT